MPRSPWTSKELKDLARAHASGKPTPNELAALLPRHTAESSINMASKMGYRGGLLESHRRWWAVAHQHFQDREREIRAWYIRRAWEERRV